MFELNTKYDLGRKRFSEPEIIDFAIQNDPLGFHLSVEEGKKSLFKSLVCSGQQPFNFFYNKHWVPKFGKTVVAGLGVDNWRFLKPVHVNEEVHCFTTITELISHPEKQTVSIRWRFEFQNAAGELFQHLEMVVLHKF